MTSYIQHHSTKKQMSESEGTVDGTGLPWGGSSSSRVGSQFQVDYLPSPDEYASVSTSSGESARGTASSSTTSTRRTRCDDEVPGLDQIWDPSLARENGVLDFVHTYVTPSLKEHAIEILHKNNYNSIGIMKELESATPLDGSDWKVKEHDSFLRLMLATEHDVNRVARRMKKSVANCLTVYYKIVNVKCHEVPSGSRRKRISTDGNPELVEVDLKIIKSDVFMSTKKRRKRKTREGKQDTQQPVLKSNKTLPNSMPSAVPSENDSAGSQLKNANEGDESKVKGMSKREQRMKRRFRARSDNSEKDMIEPISSMSDIDAKPSSVGADDVPQGSEAKTAHNTADRSHDICSSYLGTKNGCETSYTKDNGTDLISMQIKNDARIKHTSNAQSDGFASTVIATATAVATEARATRNVKNPSAFETEEQEKNGARTRQIINAQSDGVDSTVITTATAVATEACPALGVMNPVVAEPKESKDGEEQEQEQEQEKNDSSTRQTINTQSDGVASIVITTAVAIEEPEESTDSDSIVKSATILETNNADTMKLQSFITDGRHSSVSTAAKPQAKDEGGTPISEPSTGRGQYLEKSGSGEDGPRNKAIRGYTTRSARKQKFVGPSYESDLKLALKVDLEWNANESELDQPCYKSNKSLNNLAPRSLRKSRRDALVTDSLDSETRQSSRIIKDNALIAESKPGATQNPTKAITNRNQRSRGYSKASTQTSSIESTRKKSSENENKSDPSNVISDPSQPGKRIRRKSRETSTTARASSNIPINYSTTLSNPRERSSNRKKDKASESLPNKPDTLEECHGIKKRRSKRSKLQQQQDQRRQHDAYPNTGDWFEERFSTLEEYTQTHGHCLVPKIFPENQALSYWVFRIRSLYKEKMKKSKVMKSRLTDEQVKRLEEIGFQFYVKGADNQLKFEAERRKPKDDVRWDSYMKMLKAYKEKHGDCLVPKVHAPNQALSTWVFAQRQQKRFFDKKVHNRLTEEKVLELEDIGFIWRAKTNKEWQEKDRQRKQEMLSESWKIHFKRLCAYKQKHGHTRVPKNYPTDRSLSSWVFRQRGYHKKFDKEGTRNDLEIEREQKLESVSSFDHMSYAFYIENPMC